jgi:sugar phosphate isomerase/epimerase
MFAARHTFADQPRLTARALEIADLSGARIIRVFSFWRTVDPAACFPRIVEALRALADQAARHHVIVGLENEHACNIATGAETARLLAALDHPNLKVVWDPANAVVSGEKAFPEGYGKLPVSRIQHVHAKDCTMDGHQPLWCPIGDGVVGWRGQVDALVHDGYQGWLSLETHWPGPGGNKHEASMICGRKLMEL